MYTRVVREQLKKERKKNKEYIIFLCPIPLSLSLIKKKIQSILYNLLVYLFGTTTQLIPLPNSFPITILFIFFLLLQ